MVGLDVVEMGGDAVVTRTVIGNSFDVDRLSASICCDAVITIVDGIYCLEHSRPPSGIEVHQVSTCIVLSVPPGTQIVEPVQFLYVATVDSDFHVRVIVGDSAHVLIHRSLLSCIGKVTVYVDALIGKCASLHLEGVLSECEGEYYERTTAQVSASGRYHCVRASFDSAKYDDTITLCGEASEAHMASAVSIKESAAVSQSCRIDHRAPQCISRQLCKTIVDGISEATIEGTIAMSKSAEEGDATFLSHALVLSDRATVRSCPNLIIDVDDVQASHGATTGVLDENMIFYLQSRGVPRNEAQSLLQEGFIQNIMSQLEVWV